MWIYNSALNAFDRSTWIILDTFNWTTSSDLASSFGATASKFTREIGANSWLVTDWWIESAFVNVTADDTVSSFNFFKTFVTETFKTTPSVLTLRRIFEMMLTLWRYEPIKSWLKVYKPIKRWVHSIILKFRLSICTAADSHSEQATFIDINTFVKVIHEETTFTATFKRAFRKFEIVQMTNSLGDIRSWAAYDPG